VLVAALAAVLGAWPAVAAARARVTFIGDSVSAALIEVPAAARYLGSGLDLRLDLRVCRRLVLPSCPYQGVTPSTGLEAIQADGASLGHTVVIDVGYNEDGYRYASDMDQVLHVLRAEGVRTVVWVNLREIRSDYYRINAAIEREAARWPRVRVADWNSTSQGEPWFGADGLHLNAAGAYGLARLLRPQIVYAVRAAKRGSAGR
jgi:hypothetical protein